MWEHEKLEVYRKALDAVAQLDLIVRTIPDGRGDLRDQLRRASTSICLNIAEGASEFSPLEKARFYRLARRSSAECAAALDIVARVGGGTPRIATAKALLHDVAAMLTRLVRGAGERAAPGSLAPAAPEPAPSPAPE